MDTGQRPHISDRLVIATAVMGISLLTGCVEPEARRPWSTKERSLSAIDEGETLVVVEATPVEPAGVPSSTMPANTPGTGEDSVVTSVTEPAILIGNTPEDRARAWLATAANDDYALVRAYAFEAMQHAPGLLLEIGPQGLVDENRGVRFVSTMAMGRANLERLTPLIEPGLLDSSDSVRAASIFALRKFGVAADPSPLAAMAMSEDLEIRGNATMILGMLGNPSAIPIIDSALGHGLRLQNPMRVRITELQAAEALVSLGDDVDIEPIRAALFAPVEQGELTVLACDMLGRLGDQQARSMLMRLIIANGNQRRPAEIRVAAAGAVFRLPAPHEPGLERVLLEYVTAEDPRLRTQVAGALAHVPAPEARKALDQLLADDDLVVRTAAAGGLLALEQARRLTAGSPNSDLAISPPD
ncbi:MAG: hypothetical protein CMJ23_11055 [Phycisphaerae bacterium]|nr:hypothetical protein [Phycisphaerae bacterium]